MKNKTTKKKQKDIDLKRILKEKTLVAKSQIEKHANDYKVEVKKALLTAIVAAFSFLMALEWREVINSYVESLLELTSLQGNLVSASIITLISVLAILICTRFLGSEEK